MLELTEEQKAVLDAKEQRILVTARPGRGKTTLALLLADRIIRDKQIGPTQQVIFLTFSRNSVYQIAQASTDLLTTEVRNRLWIATYHSFMWWLLSTFGRFQGLPRKLDVMGETKAKTAKIIATQANVDKDQWGSFFAKTYSAISYDEFAQVALPLIHNSVNIRSTLHNRFPVVIVDEFQDTNAEQWELVKAIAGESRLICFADPDQMIYRWRGASTDRLGQFRDEHHAKHYKLQEKCLRTGEHHLLSFAEAILDDAPVNYQERTLRKQRFLGDYPGSNALGVYLKYVIKGFYNDFKRRNAQPRHNCFPTIAIAAFSNRDAGNIQDELGRPTPKAKETYRCKLLEGAIDNPIKELIIHLAMWSAGGGRKEIEQAIQLIGGMLTEDPSKASGPIRALFFPGELLDGISQAKETAKKVLEQFEPLGNPCAETSTEAIDRAVIAIASLLPKVASIGKVISDADLQSSRKDLTQILAIAPHGTALHNLRYLRDRIAAEKLHREVLEKVTPVRGIISTTLHKLKGREFDYVCIVTRSGDNLRGAGDTDKDARRLMYVALTRARYDARILYELIQTFDENTRDWLNPQT